MMPQPCDECRLLIAELVAAQKTQMNEAREREKTAAVPFAERLRKMTDAEWNQMMEAQRSPSYTEAARKLRHHQLTRHAGQFF